MIGNKKNQSEVFICDVDRFPQSTSTTPKPPARTKKEQKEKEKQAESPEHEIKNTESAENEKKPNICSRLMGKCKTKCCPCCVKGENDDEKEMQNEMVEDLTGRKQGMMSKFGCCKKTKVEEEVETEIERSAGKVKFHTLAILLNRGNRVSLPFSNDK